MFYSLCKLSIPNCLHIFSDSPGIPTALKIMDEKITLSWEEVTHAESYIIEMRAQHSNSWKVAADDIKKTMCTIEDLMTGEELNFRVIAVSGALKSTPGPQEKFIIEGN